MSTTDTQYLTPEKRIELQKELDFLKAEKRKEVAEHLEYAKKLGDLSENAEYHQAREEQGVVEDRIRYVEDLLKNALTASASRSNLITVGSTVKLAKEGATDKKVYTYTIVGSEEVDTLSGKISHASPIGSTLLGHKEGDTVSIQTPKGTMIYRVVSLQ
jgi:transcription elongation factor GreA